MGCLFYGFLFLRLLQLFIFLKNYGKLHFKYLKFFFF